MEQMERMGKMFCIECGNFSEYEIRSEQIQCEVRGTPFTCTEETAYCRECGEAVYVPEMNDRNVQAREDAYRKAAGLISVEEMNAEPLGLVLGFGKVTINRYIGGQLPSKANSEKLFEVLRSRRKMAELLDLDTDSLNADEISVLDAVIKMFGRYSGKTLESMTHLEDPWIKARAGLSPNDRGHSIVSKDDISAYFKKKCQELDITMPRYLENYCDDAFERVTEQA